MRPAAPPSTPPSAFPNAARGRHRPARPRRASRAVGAVDPAQPLPLAETGAVHAGDPVFVRVDDGDQNRDSTVRETVEVRVSARAPATARRCDCARRRRTPASSSATSPRRSRSAVRQLPLQLARDSSLDVAYVDPRDPRRCGLASGLVDPFGVVFDSTTGEPVDGVRVRLLDGSGRPAIVFGDDGSSRYPAEVITGQPVTDAGGTTYRLPPGVYRFPLVASPVPIGSWSNRPMAMSFTSTASVDELQRLPGAPFPARRRVLRRVFRGRRAGAGRGGRAARPAGQHILSLRKSANTESRRSAISSPTTWWSRTAAASPRSATLTVIETVCRPACAIAAARCAIDGQPWRRARDLWRAVAMLQIPAGTARAGRSPCADPLRDRADGRGPRPGARQHRAGATARWPRVRTRRRPACGCATSCSPIAPSSWAGWSPANASDAGPAAAGVEGVRDLPRGRPLRRHRSGRALSLRRCGARGACGAG